MAGEMLRVTGGNAAGTMIPLDGELLIGRAAEGGGTLGGDRLLSRQHARLRRDKRGYLVLEDLASSNGTFVNGTRLVQPQILNAGDSVRVGETTLQLVAAAPVAPASPPAPPAVPAANAPTPPAPPPPAGPDGAGRGRGRLGILIGGAAALVVLAVVAVVLLAGGDGDGGGEE